MKTLRPLAMIFCGLFAVVNSALTQTWIQQINAPATNWQSVAASADGSILVAAVGRQVSIGNLIGGIFVSTNSGAAWFQTSAPGTNFYISVVASADGTKLAANYINHNAVNGGIYRSTDSGTTWTLSSTNISPAFFGLSHSIASSADGSKLAALGSSIYTSTDGGVSWSSNNVASAIWASVASSADGSKLAAVSFNSHVYISTNSGVTWTSNNVPYGVFQSIASSADGCRLIAAGGSQIPGPIYTSSDSGMTWISNSAPVAPWKDVVSSADGTKLAATTFASNWTNNGTVWATNTTPASGILSLVSSADGAKLIAVNGNGSTVPGGIYIWQTVRPPQLNFTSASNNLELSWLVPSTNFVLQQNLDLSTPNWETLTNTPTLNLTNLNNELTLPPTNNSGFFRLISQ